MKAITKLFLVIFAAITCFGCEKIENDNNKGQNTQEDFLSWDREGFLNRSQKAQTIRKRYYSVNKIVYKYIIKQGSNILRLLFQ